MYIKVFIITLISILSFQNNSNLKFYKEALDIILDSKEYSLITVNKNKYHVSSEVLAYPKGASFFVKELNTRDDLVTWETISREINKKNLIDKKLLKLNKKKCGKVQIFFSAIEKNIFFAEIFESKKSFDYENRPNFGKSIIYMFEYKNNIVNLISKQELTYG